MANDYKGGKRDGRDGGDYKLPHGGSNPFRIHTEKELKERNEYHQGYLNGRAERERQKK